MVQIEINLLKLERGTHEERVKVTRGGKTFYRRQRVGRKDKPIKSPNLIENLYDLTDGDSEETKEILDRGGWNFEKSIIFTNVSAAGGAYIHKADGKIYALSILEREGDLLHIEDIEVNPGMQRQGYGKQAMRDIISFGKVDKISVLSMDEGSNKFYESIGMKKIPKKDPKHFQEFIGDKIWMKMMME